MSPDNDKDVSKSESRSEGTSSSSQGRSTASSHTRSVGTSSTGTPITPETHKPEDLKTIHYVAGSTARGWIDRARTFFGGKK